MTEAPSHRLRSTFDRLKAEGWLWAWMYVIFGVVAILVGPALHYRGFGYFASIGVAHAYMILRSKFPAKQKVGQLILCAGTVGLVLSAYMSPILSGRRMVGEVDSSFSIDAQIRRTYTKVISDGEMQGRLAALLQLDSLASARDAVSFQYVRDISRASFAVTDTGREARLTSALKERSRVRHIQDSVIHMICSAVQQDPGSYDSVLVYRLAVQYAVTDSALDANRAILRSLYQAPPGLTVRNPK